MVQLKQLLVAFIGVVLHPFYVSITDIAYNAEAKRIEVSCRIFYDDLETALQAEGIAKPDLINPGNRPSIDSALSRYLVKNLRLTADGKPMSLQYLGYEIADDVAWCYLEAGSVPQPGSLAIDNRILFGQFSKQSNIMHVTVGGKRKSVKLDNPTSKAALDFEK